MKIKVLNFGWLMRALFVFAPIALVIISLGFGNGLVEYVTANLPNGQKAQTLPTVIIDAGHGGEDPGAIGSDGTLEKELNLNIALLVGEELISRGYNVLYTRTEDKMLYSPDQNIKGLRKISDLKNRVKLANETENALLISIHMNSFGTTASGPQIFCSDKEGSEVLAKELNTALKEKLNLSRSRPIKSQKGIYLLENAECDAVLIECGFLSNPEECKKPSEKDYQKQLSFAIVCGIINYVNILKEVN